MNESSILLGIGVMFLAPLFSFLSTFIGILDLSIKDTYDFIQKVNDLLQKQKMGTVSNIIEAATSTNPGVAVSQDQLKTICHKFDRIVEIEKLKSSCEEWFTIYKWTMYLLVVFCAIMLLLGLSITSVLIFVEQFYVMITMGELAVLLVEMAFLLNIKSRLRTEYGKEYTI